MSTYPNGMAVSSAANAVKPSLYEEDFCGWIDQMVQQLRHYAALELEGDTPSEKTSPHPLLSNTDLQHLITELESMGRREKRAVYNNLKILLMHLLKYRYQPEKRSNSWRVIIREHRQRLQGAFEDSPSLRNHFQAVFAPCYNAARELAADETGLALEALLPTSPFSQEDTLDGDYLPD